jgi:hypothetical protein
MTTIEQNKLKERERSEFRKWIKSKNFHIYSTVTFKNKLSDQTINRKMGDFTKHYLIDDIVWFREFTSDGKPHIHMVIQVNKLKKGWIKLKSILKDWGNTQFDLFDNKRSSECISYISKEYNKPNSLWGIENKKYQRTSN